MFINTHREEI